MSGYNRETKRYNEFKRLPDMAVVVEAKKLGLHTLVATSYVSWRGHISHGNTFNLKKQMDDYFFNIFPEARGRIQGVHYVKAVK